VTLKGINSGELGESNSTGVGAGLIFYTEATEATETEKAGRSDGVMECWSDGQAEEFGLMGYEAIRERPVMSTMTGLVKSSRRSHI
jgi:hypothetical protein